MTSTTKKWIKGLAATAISAMANAAGGVILLPDVFNISKHGMLNTLKLIVVPTALAVSAYLKRSPLSDVTAVIDEKGNITAVEGSVDVDVKSAKN